MARHEKLIRELIALYLRYGEKDFDEAIQKLTNGASLQPLLQSASLAAQVARMSTITDKSTVAHRSKKRVTTKETLERYVEKLGSEKDRTPRLVAQFLKDALDGSVLRTSRSLRGFAVGLGLPERSRGDRYAVLKQIGDRLLSGSEDEVRRVITLALQSSSEGSSLERWTNIIVKPTS